MDAKRYILGRRVILTAVFWLVGLLVGLMVGFIALSSDSWLAPLEWIGVLIRRSYELVGIALIGLAPLAVWLVRILIQHFAADPDGGKTRSLDLTYISSGAVEWGLLGTVVSLAMAGGSLATEVRNGSVAAVLSVIPLVGQALISTVIGLIISICAKTALHFQERSELN